MTHIPYGGYWTTPFCRWQGSLANEHALDLASRSLARFIEERALEPDAFDLGVLGTTVPQQGAFYALPTLAAKAGLPHLAGPTIAQACATSARCLSLAHDEVREGRSQQCLVVTADRTSNGPQILYPAPDAPGGAARLETWVLDNFASDPWAGLAMVDTAENVAAERAISREEQDAVALHRSQQYEATPAAFHDRYMQRPLDVTDARGRVTATITGDEGIRPSTAEGLARLTPVRKGGTVTYGAQTHPADGNAGLVVTTPERARDLSVDPAIVIQLLAFGQSRERKGYMPSAPIEAARNALGAADLGIADVDAITSHNPFAVNDIAFSRAFDIDWRDMNRHGCSLVWGHPQAPTGLRSVIELIEGLVERGGGVGLFEGCAGGDTGMAVVLRVYEARA